MTNDEHSMLSPSDVDALVGALQSVLEGFFEQIHKDAMAAKNVQNLATRRRSVSVGKEAKLDAGATELGSC